MNTEAIAKLGPFAAARKSSLMSQEQMAAKVGCSLPTLVKMEKNPEEVSLANMGVIYQSVGADGKAIIEKYVNDFFVA